MKTCTEHPAFSTDHLAGTTKTKHNYSQEQQKHVYKLPMYALAHETKTSLGAFTESGQETDRSYSITLRACTLTTELNLSEITTTVLIKFTECIFFVRRQQIT